MVTGLFKVTVVQEGVVSVEVNELVDDRMENVCDPPPSDFVPVNSPQEVRSGALCTADEKVNV